MSGVFDVDFAELPQPCPMTQPRGRRAFIAYKEGLGHAQNYSDPVTTKNSGVVCEYTAAAINPNSSCISVQHFHHNGRPQMLAFGGSRAVCLAQAVNNDIRVFRTLSGHKETVSCVMWIDSFKGPTITRFHSLLISASTDGEVKLWDIGEDSQRELISFNVTTSVISVHGCYTDASETQLIVCAASQDSITGSILKLTLSNGVASAAETMSEQFCIKLESSSCLTLRLACLTGPLVLLFAGMTTGCLEVRLVKPGEASVFLAGTLKGHVDWLNCLDCVQMYPSKEVDASQVEGDHILLATGSLDKQIRIWHVQLLEGKDRLPSEKGQLLELPTPYRGTHRLIARLESVLSAHDNWVTDVAWSPVPWTPMSCPQLLSSSRDKSLVIWAPSQPLFSSVAANGGGDEEAPDIWLEQARFGTVGGASIGYLGCAWGHYNSEVYGHGFWGDLSTWSTNSEPRITLTGHFKSVTSLSWCRETIDGVSLESPSCPAYPPYLLTASQDSTVRLHGLFYTGGSGCSPPVRMWRELARPQVHGYEMNDIVSLDVVHYVSAGDEKVGRVFSATSGFVKSLLSDATIAAHPGLQTLPTSAVQQALGLSNQAAVEEEEESSGESNAPLTNPLYPPTESVLAESTLWTETNKLYGHSYEVFSLAAHPKGCLVASACKAAKQEFARILLWRTDNWHIHQHLSFHRLTVSNMRFDSTGDRLVSVSRDRMWALWKVDGSAGDDFPTFQLHKHSQPGKNAHSRIIWACAWSPDYRTFLTASRDKQIMAWDGESGERVAPPWVLSEAITAFDVGSDISGHNAFFATAGFETGGIELLAISLTSGTCQSLWKMPADWTHMGLPVRCLTLHSLDSESVALASGGDDGIVRIFRISPSSLMESATNCLCYVIKWWFDVKLNFRDASAEVITTITAYSHPRSKTAAEFARLQWSLKRTLDSITCLILYFSVYSSEQKQTEFTCLLVTSFSQFWFFFSLRAWSNIATASYHHRRILFSSNEENYQVKWRTCLTLLLAALISAIIAALAMVYYAEYDFEWSFCGNIFDFEGELLPNRFILVRYLYIVSITLNYLLPVTATIWFYSEVLESLREFEAPTVVVEAVERLILLDGYLLLWLSAPIHMLELIQLMHWKEELPHGNVYVKVLTMIAGAYCIMHPICRLVLNKTFRNK
ncbi:Elongator complex protein 2 [Echinococcus granulosus]|uniref:Elongator complex protein 2 n=1 Tax=Echinococcus granulosus TaxID=6210 RepID=W6U660_ECHGR|nr:Elongator complex protein 2 [Echinococcus granulosus]EUB56698.1 Elongator complex protein 2 [Echinococcus granulosus]